MFELPENPEEMSLEELKSNYKKAIAKIKLQKAEMKRDRKEIKFLLSAIKHIPNAMFILDEESGFVIFSRECSEIFGKNMDMFIGKTFLDLTFIPEDDRITFQKEDIDLLDSLDVLHYEKDFLFADGEMHPCLYWSKGFEVEETGEKGIVGEIVDITVEKKLEAQLEAASKIDPGTGLFNRYVFDSQTRAIIAEARETGLSVGVLICDLDHFKRVNDTFGHLEGDRVLKDFADIIKGCIRDVDVPIRYGGEEFLVFLYGLTLEQSAEVAERIRATTEENLILPDGSHITVSSGVVKFNPEETRTQCIERADSCLYNAKETGRNKVVVG